MMLISTAFSDGGSIPSKYTCDGENISPPLTFFEIDPNVKSLVLIVEDPDAPKANFTHWLVFNILPSTLRLSENQQSGEYLLGMNDFGQQGYSGPCPPSGNHRYTFQLFALDTLLDLPAGVSKDQILDAIQDHVIDKAQLVGLYQKT